MILGVMVGGALGALLRYLTGVGLQGWLGGFPLATLLVNVTGSFLLSLLVYGVPGLSPTLRTAIGTGFIGALTTFSTFGLEADALLREARWLQASLYVLGNLVLGFGAVLLGRWLAYSQGAGV